LIHIIKEYGKKIILERERSIADNVPLLPTETLFLHNEIIDIVKKTILARELKILKEVRNLNSLLIRHTKIYQIQTLSKYFKIN
jgi:hypothetical protein